MDLESAYKELATPGPDSSSYEILDPKRNKAKAAIAVFKSAGSASKPFLPKMKALVKTYNARIPALVYHTFRSLENDIKQIEFDLTVKPGACGCEYRKKIHLTFNENDINWLAKIGHHEPSSDYDFAYTVYECRQCKTKWTHEMDDDTDDGDRWLLWNEKNHPF